MVGREYRRRLKKAFDAHGIEIPVPHLSLYAGSASPPFNIHLDQAAAATLKTPPTGEAKGKDVRHEA